MLETGQLWLVAAFVLGAVGGGGKVDKNKCYLFDRRIPPQPGLTSGASGIFSLAGGPGQS